MQGTPSKWRTILLLDDRGDILKSYPLDEKARHLLPMKRQKRRNLGRMTGKKGFANRKTDDSEDSSSEVNEEKEIETKTVRRSGRIRTKRINHSSSDGKDEKMYFEPEQTEETTKIVDLTSIDWLLNQRE